MHHSQPDERDPGAPLEGLALQINIPYLTAGDVERQLTPIAAIDALEAALTGGLDPRPIRRAASSGSSTES